jgi:hypothetical protein
MTAANLKEIRRQVMRDAALARVPEDPTIHVSPTSVGAAIGLSPTAAEGLLKELVEVGKLRIERPQTAHRTARLADGFWPEFRRPTAEELAAAAAVAERRAAWEAVAENLSRALGAPVEVAMGEAGFMIGPVATAELGALAARAAAIVEAFPGAPETLPAAPEGP